MPPTAAPNAGLPGVCGFGVPPRRVEAREASAPADPEEGDEAKPTGETPVKMWWGGEGVADGRVLLAPEIDQGGYEAQIDIQGDMMLRSAVSSTCGGLVEEWLKGMP